MSTLDTLTQIFRDVFDDGALCISDETTADDVEGWDSFTHVYLIKAVEVRFGVRFGTAELLALRTVGDLLRCIEDKLPA